jgi:hypothetical protein
MLFAIFNGPGVFFFALLGASFANIEGIWDGSWDTFAYLVEM